MSYIGRSPDARTLGLSQKNVFAGDGSTVNFDMTTAAPEGGDTAVDVFVDNVRQEPGTGKAYVVAVDGSGDFKRITFSAAPANGAVIYTLNRLRTQISNILPSAGTVSTSILGDNSVTGPKIAMGSDAQGDVLYYNGTDYVRLGPGTSGQALTTGGAGANVSWTTISTTMGGDISGTTGNAQIVADAVTATEIAAGAVAASELASDAVTTVKILNANVTAAKLASDAVTTVKILNSNVTTAKIADNNVTLAKIADGTQGGLIYMAGSGAPTELAAGTSGYFLKTLGSGANPAWAEVPAGAPTGGGSEKVFYENEQTVDTNYTLTTNFNAVSAGPVTVASGVTVTIPAGQAWVIV